MFKRFGLVVSVCLTALLIYSCSDSGSKSDVQAVYANAAAFEGYVNKYADLLAAYNANSGGRTKSAWGEWHYCNHGRGEGRTYSGLSAASCGSNDGGGNDGGGNDGGGNVNVPNGTPYVTYTADIKDGGSGTGHSAYINVHDAYNNALSVGIQSDTAAPETGGAPWYIWQRVQNGVFTFKYIKSATTSSGKVTIKWWKDEQVAVVYENGTAIANISVRLTPRLFFNAEGNARLNGDSVNSTVKNVDITVGTDCPTYCGLNGSWNTTNFNFYGLTATNTNGRPQNGANFSITGTATGIPPGLDWDTTPNPVGGIGKIAQYWNGQ